MRKRDRSLTEAGRSSEVVTGSALPREHTSEPAPRFYPCRRTEAGGVLTDSYRLEMRFSGDPALSGACDLYEGVRTALAFFLELFFFTRTEPGGWAQRFAIIEDGQIAHVQRKSTRRRFLIDDDRDRAALDAFAKRDATTARKTSVCKTLQHSTWIIPRGRVAGSRART